MLGRLVFRPFASRGRSVSVEPAKPVREETGLCTAQGYDSSKGLRHAVGLNAGQTEQLEQAAPIRTCELAFSAGTVGELTHS